MLPDEGGEGPYPGGMRSPDGPESRTAPGAELRWVAVASASVLAVWLVAWRVEYRRYFLGDTPNAYYGWLFQYGTALRHGRWPLLSVENMSAGNHVAEGQMGLFNPVSALIALGTTVAPDLVLYMTLVKLAIALVGIVGAYGLARSYDVAPPLAAVAATAVGLCGLTLLAEAPRWLTGQLVAAYLPWAWWLTRRAMRGRHPLPAVVAGLLVVTVGYVYGTLYLMLVLLGLLAEAAVHRDRRALVRGLVVAVVCGLVAVAVYLPGVETVPVTLRHSDIGGSGTFRLRGPLGFLLLGQPAGAGTIPFAYAGWWLPLLVLTDLDAVRRGWRSLVSLLVPAALFTAWSLGPYEIGPIRWPGRILDAFTLVLALLAVVLLSRYRARASAGRLALLVVWVLASLLVAWHEQPDPSPAVRLLVTGAVLAGLVVAWRTLVPGSVGASGAVGLRATALVLVVGAVAVGVFQVVRYQAIVAPQRNMPAALSAYDDYLPGARGDVWVVDGRAWTPDGEAMYTADRARYLLTGSLWALTGKQVHNGYSTIGFRPYTVMFCTLVGGEVCPDALTRMLRRDPETGLSRADLLSISTLVVGLNDHTRRLAPPAGWHVAARNPYAVTWVRDRPVPAAGGVVWTSPGLSVSQVGRGGDLGVRLRVDRVPSAGGDLVLSRLAWPGYHADGGRLVAPLEGMLVRVHVDGSSAGHEVSVVFRPPGWPLELACLALALLLTVGWCALLVLRRRSRPDAADPGPGRSAEGGARGGVPDVGARSGSFTSS